MGKKKNCSCKGAPLDEINFRIAHSKTRELVQGGLMLSNLKVSLMLSTKLKESGTTA